MCPPGMRRLSSPGGALGDDAAVVEDRDPVGELVGLVEVLRGEEDRDAVGDQVADDLPHGRGGCAGRARWSARRGRSGAGRRPASSRGRAGAACRRSRSSPAFWPRRPGRTGPSRSAARRRPSARPRWCRSAIRIRFSSPVSRLSTAENWPVTPIAARTASGSAARSWPATLHLAAVGADQRGQDLHHGGLAGAVGAEQREDRPLGDGQVDAVEHHLVAVRLAQPGDRNRGPGGGHCCHLSSFQERRITMSP